MVKNLASLQRAVSAAMLKVTCPAVLLQGEKEPLREWSYDLLSMIDGYCFCEFVTRDNLDDFQCDFIQPQVEVNIQ